MRSKDHHLKRRGNRWFIRYDVPTEVRTAYRGQPVRGIEEALGTSDKLLARRLRDRRLRELEGKWAAIRQSIRRSESTGLLSPTAETAVDSYETWALQVRKGASDPHNFETALGEALTEAADKDDEEDAERIYEALAIARGELTPLREIADEYLSSIEHLNTSTLSTRRKAIAILASRFATIEEIDHRKARNFLVSLMKGEGSLTKRTVNQYAQAYRGVWRHLGLDKSIWTLEGLASETKTTLRQQWSDTEYLKLLETAQNRGERDMFLAIRIAAHTGAAAQGVASAKLLDDDTDHPSIYLTETKKDHRSRKIPCHPAIRADMREWMATGGLRSDRASRGAGGLLRHNERSLSRKFTRLKQSLGFGPEKVFHSFRHAVANKLENARAYDREIKRLLGHYIADITFGTYSAQGLGSEALEQVVKKINWPDYNGAASRSGHSGEKI